MSSGEENIVSNIRSEAQMKADKIISDAQQQAQIISDDGASNREAEKQKILDDAKKTSDMRYQQIISEAKMKGRRLELDAREDLIDDSFNKAIENIKGLSTSGDSTYTDSLEKIITEAAIELGGGDLIVQVNNEDKSKAQNILDKISQSVTSSTGNETKISIGDDINTIGGAILKTSNGDVEVNNTIESRISRYKKSLRLEVANILFK
ncbi:MAG: V-type proton ATPase subunit E [Methanobrevibacter sp.]|jgi:V/A-type H+-transporting ATPase subunit E|nr:V-type proton ATPase subunit E [Candidatus Methanoflexus mossambicus]